MVEWIEKVELGCDLCRVKRLEHVIPLQLIRGSFSVYQQLTKEEKFNATEIKDASCTAFATGYFMAYKQFEVQNLHPDEAVDIYLAVLKKLVILFRWIPDHEKQEILIAFHCISLHFIAKE